LAGRFLANQPLPHRKWAASDDGERVDVGRAYDIIDNWRAAHSGPMTTVYITLHRKAKAIYPSALVVQRLKRQASIQLKLENEGTMRLVQMQDIGGCRAIVRSVGEVRRLYRQYSEWPVWGSICDEDDYITKPKVSGYRGIHLIYRYEGKKPDWHGLKVEIQLRSRRMHAWATAVEIVGAFTHQALKASQGEAEWLRFFALMSSALARVEHTHTVAGTPRRKRDLTGELRSLATALRFAVVLDTYRSGLQIALSAPTSAYWFVLVLDLNTRHVDAYGWNRSDFAAAQERYESIEREQRPGINAVLVSSDSVRNLKRAYPNYFLDAEFFVELVHDAIG
jgi:hypothetical protein